MRIRRLGLERYGRFTDHELDFDPSARVILIQGANEAGKTTALAAVADALFGIEQQSRFNFLHEYRTMRLSATVADGQGRTLSFARLKRRSATLVDPVTDAPLADDSLAPFLGAYDRQAFLNIFGLDQRRLREGGRKLLAGRGDLEETLLAAAPGLQDVSALRDRLRDNAARVFNPDRRTASHGFYMALEQRTQARQRLREQELRIEDVNKLRDEADLAAAAREAAVAAEIEAGLAAVRADSLRAAARELRTLDAAQADRAAMGTLPPVPADFTARARELLGALEIARADARRSADEESAAAAARAAISVDGEILALAEEIEAGDDERAAVQKELLSLPNRRAEMLDARARLGRIAAGLGLADVETLRARLPAPPGLSRADRLADQLHAADERIVALDRERIALAEQRRSAEEARARLGHVADPTLARRRLIALDGAEEREGALRALDRRLTAAGRSLTERAVRLGIGLADADGLAALLLPAPTAAEQQLAALKAAADMLVRRRETLGTLEEQGAVLAARLDALNAGRPAPTEAAIAEARQARDELWSVLRPLALRQRVATEDDRDVAARLDAAITGADRIADERQSETQRLADLAGTERDLADARARIVEASKRAADAEAQVASAHVAWQALWEASGRSMAPDEQAPAMLREVEAIRQARDTLRADAAEAEERRAAVRLGRQENDRLREEFGLPPLRDAPLRMADLRQAVAELEARFQQARDSERELTLLEARFVEFDARAADARQQAESLARQAGELFPALAIQADARAAEARAALGLWREAAGCISDLATAERRVAGIERNAATFAGRLNALLDRLQLPPAADPFAAARDLRRRLDAARQACARAETADRALALRREAEAGCRAALRRAEEALAALQEAVGLDPSVPVAPLLDPLDRAAACDRRIAEARQRLADIGGARSEAELRAGVGGLDEDMLARRAAEAHAQHDAARMAVPPAVERDTRARGAIEALDQRVGAAGAAQDEQDALAAIAEAVELFTRNHVAARLLSAAIERYREQYQNPIVERASRAFSGLTGGRWEGVGIDYDEEPPRLAARRGGRIFGVDALSEGTADQLFLALRVAAIEEHAKRATPLPFIADDLFVSFDEARTEAGLSLLAELGALTQVIVFTHHAHLAACAARALGDQVATIVLG